MLEEIYHQQMWGLLGPIRALLEAPDVGEVMINGPHEVFVERGGKLQRTDAKFEDEEALMAALRLVSQRSGRELSRDQPILEASLPDGSRLEAVVPPAAPRGPQVAIRRFSRKTMSLATLLEMGSVTPQAVRVLEGLVRDRHNVLVAGGTGTGKTSLLNALAALIPQGERVVTLEDATELQLATEHVVQLEAQAGDAKGAGRVTLRHLLAASLRLRPDRIVVGEVRDGAALDMVHAMLSGHAGCMSTVHANDTRSALQRVETLCLMTDLDLPLSALRGQIATAIDAVVHITRLRDGRRVVTGVDAVEPSEGEYRIAPMYAREVDHG